MASNILNARLSLKRDTLANWLASNFEKGSAASDYLRAGEIAVVEVADGDIRFKVGDGATKFSELPYTDAVAMSGSYVPLTRKVNGHALSADVTVSKSDIGLGNVENKSSATIRGELTSSNVTTALGYTPLKTYTDTKTTLSYVTTGTPSISTTGATGTITLGQAASKLVDTSIASGSSSTNLPTSAAVASFVKGVIDGYNPVDNNTTYKLTQDSTDGHKITLTPYDGETAGTAMTITIPDNNTTYTASNGITLSGTEFYNSGVVEIDEDSTNGCILVYYGNGTGSGNPRHGSSVKVHGLGSAAYTASTAYTPAAHASNTSNPHGVTAAQVQAIPTSQKGAASGVAELDANGKVPAAQLPSYVDDVIEGNGTSSFPTTGEEGKIYVDTSTNKTYRWSGTTYVEISASLALGTTSSTAYRGDLGAAAYAHAVTNKGSAFSSGLYKITTNSEGHVTGATTVTKSDITALGIPGQDTTYTIGGLMGSTAIGSTTSPIYWTGSKFATTGTLYSTMTGATASAAGTTGYVPAPAKGAQGLFLRGDGTWATPTNTTYSAGTGLSLSGTTFNHSNSVTAKTAYDSTATTASANGGSITVTDIKYDAQGHITGSTDRKITLSQTTYSLSGLGGIGSITANNGLTYSKSGTTATLGISSVSTDLLTQGSNTLIWDCGTATTVI